MKIKKEVRRTPKLDECWIVKIGAGRISGTYFNKKEDADGHLEYLRKGGYEGDVRVIHMVEKGGQDGRKF